MKALTVGTLSFLISSALAAPFELVSKRPLASHEWTRSPNPLNPRANCPALLPDGEFEFPHYITQISASEPDKAFGMQYNGVFTPNDISSIFSFDIPASRTDANCTLEFIFPKLEDLKTSSFSISGGGNFVFTGYAPGSCPGPATTYNNQPAPGPFPAFPPVKLEPGYVYTLDVGPCFVGAGTCVAGKTETSDTTFTYFQDIGNADQGDCPIGIYTTYSYIS
ncbi:hypothetical protein diail_11715 [Diaporthe ilicicola]|nr:hypothetical protein diail_11715 [Diaporthe ilicicola]